MKLTIKPGIIIPTIYKFQPYVAFHIGFHMKCDTEPKWVKGNFRKQQTSEEKPS